MLLTIDTMPLSNCMYFSFNSKNALKKGASIDPKSMTTLCRTPSRKHVLEHVYKIYVLWLVCWPNRSGPRSTETLLSSCRHVSLLLRIAEP